MSYPCVQIGCGVRAQFHIKSMNRSTDFDIVAVCDLDEELAERTANEFDIPAAYTDFRTALRKEGPTHVTIVLPPPAKPAVVPEVLAFEPASVIMEKPVANTLQEATSIAEAAQDIETDVTISHQSIYLREARALKRWIESGRIGEPRRVVATTRGWLLSMGTHVVHLLDWIVDGSPTKTRGFAGGPEWMVDNPIQAQEPDSTMFELCYPDDIRAYLNIGDEAPTIEEREGTRWLETRLDIIGTEGHAEFVHTHHASVTDTDGNHDSVAAAEIDDDGWVETHSNDTIHGTEHPWEFAYINGYATEGLYADQAAVIDGRLDRHPADLGSAMRVHEIFDGVMRSAIEGRTQSPSTPPALGISSNERLQRRLSARRPICFASMLYHDRSRAEVLRSLSSLGISNVDLWAFSPFSEHFDPREEPVDAVVADLERYQMQAPVISIYNEAPVRQKLAFAAELGAETAVMHWRPEQEDEIRRWLDVAEELEMSLAFENHVDMALETIDDMLELLDRLDHPAAGICLAPPHSWIVGEQASDAISRLGDAIDVLYLWDIERGANRSNVESAYERADNQVPGGGGAIDFERCLEAAVEHAPGAHWVTCYHGTESWGTERIEQSVARSLRYLERARPT